MTKEGLSDIFMVIDMQDFFIPDWWNIVRPCDIYIEARRNLISNIISRWREYEKYKKRIFLVEFEWHQRTIRAINETLWKSAWVIKKIEADLTSIKNKDVVNTLVLLKDAWRTIELAWVNATWCVLASCSWLAKHLFKINIRVNSILNWHFNAEHFISINSISYIKQKFRNHIDKFSWKTIDLEHCLDYWEYDSYEAPDMQIWKA